MTKPSTAIVKSLTPSEVAALAADFPVEPSFQRAYLPRIAYKSQDVTEKTKNPKTGKSEIKVLVEAGTFLTDRPKVDEEGNAVLDEETGKQLRDVEEIGLEMEGVIVFQRKQLRYFDESTGSFTSSPIYDADDEIIPLFRDRAEIDRGTAKELQSREEYAGVSLKGKPKSNLEENRVLYVLYNDELFELNIRGSSKFSYLEYGRKCRPAVPAVLTHFSSEGQEKGDIRWNQMTFDVVRPLSSKEAAIVKGKQDELKAAIEQEKNFYAGQNAPVGNAELADEFKK